MTDVPDAKTLMDQAAPTALHYFQHIENGLLVVPDFVALREHRPDVYFRLVGDLVKAASADYAGAIVARAIDGAREPANA